MKLFAILILRKEHNKPPKVLVESKELSSFGFFQRSRFVLHLRPRFSSGLIVSLSLMLDPTLSNLGLFADDQSVLSFTGEQSRIDCCGGCGGIGTWCLLVYPTNTFAS